ncbi:putative transporter [Lactobacillus helveticus]|nr:putative transporter [Lactobacillus helveticus]
MGNYSTPIAVTFQKAVGEWGYVLVIAGMLISIFGVAFASSFNTPALIASLATEHSMLPSWIGKKNKHDAAWVAILFSAVISAILITQSYLFLVSCIVLASFVQYVPSIGCLEGFNRKIKQIERTAFGYSSFTNLLTRIRLEENLYKEKEPNSLLMVA